jgi:hypothetical protein
MKQYLIKKSIGMTPNSSTNPIVTSPDVTFYKGSICPLFFMLELVSMDHKHLGVQFNLLPRFIDLGLQVMGCGLTSAGLWVKIKNHNVDMTLQEGTEFATINLFELGLITQVQPKEIIMEKPKRKPRKAK